MACDVRAGEEDGGFGAVRGEGVKAVGALAGVVRASGLVAWGCVVGGGDC